MPLIPNGLTYSVFYLFPDEESALNSKHAGGTGFFVYVRTKAGNNYHYAVTNRHVIEKGSSFVIRVNTDEGRLDTIPLTLCDWVNHQNGADIAVARIEPSQKHRYKAIPVDWFVTPEFFPEGGVDLGAEVYMLGRFIYHGGRTFNMPSARSGIISAFPNPNELIPVDGLPDQEAFLVEMRSISGFSGSPVFVNLIIAEFWNKFRLIMDDVYNIEPKNPIVPDNNFRLFGIDAGNFPLMEKVVKKVDKNDYEKTDYRANNHSGFSIVIPAWKILETLNSEEFVTERKEQDMKSSLK